MKTSDLKNTWENFKGSNGYLQRLDPNHPMDFFVGISDKGYEEIVLLTDNEPAKLSSSKALGVEKNRRNTDGKWATQIFLLDEDNADIFARLCVDLVECSQSSKSESEGLSCVTKRYLAWQKLFARLKDTLSKEMLKGLIGEIDFLKVLIKNGYSKDDALASWLGPEGADRDFALFDTWVENKAISTGKDKVKISSLNQLEIDVPGFISIINIDESSRTDDTAFSVKSFIDDFRGFISDAPVADTLFEQKLVSLGYLDKNAYDEIYFKLGSRDYYNVDEAFPRLTTAKVEKEIVAAEYFLSIVGIQPWKVDEESLWK